MILKFISFHYDNDLSWITIYHNENNPQDYYLSLCKWSPGDYHLRWIGHKINYYCFYYSTIWISQSLVYALGILALSPLQSETFETYRMREWELNWIVHEIRQSESWDIYLDWHKRSPDMLWRRWRPIWISPVMTTALVCSFGWYKRQITKE